MYRSLMQVYVKNSNEAVAFYENAFEAQLLCKHHNPDGSIAHAELDIFGQVMAICEARESDVITGNTMQFCLHLGEGKESTVEKIYERLRKDCMEITASITKPGECPWSPCLFGLIDKYGVNWSVFA